MRHSEDFSSDAVEILKLLTSKISLREGKLEFDVSAIKSLSAYLLEAYSKGAAETIVELNALKLRKEN